MSLTVLLELACSSGPGGSSIAYVPGDRDRAGGGASSLAALHVPVVAPDGSTVSGRGSITLSSVAKGSFSVTGGIRNGTLRGRLDYDHSGPKGRDGPKVKGTGVTQYLAVDAATHRIEGTARVNGAPGFTYKVDVSDRGGPGQNDTFAIRLFNAYGELFYSASGTLGAGDIRLHEAHRDEASGTRIVTKDSGG